MKFLYILFTILFLTTPVFSHEEQEEGSPPEEMTKIMQCMATNIVLSHLHNQIAASLATLSAPSGQTVKAMSKGYIDLAKTENDHIKDFVKVAEELFIPQLIAHGQTKEEVANVSNKLLSKIVNDILVSASNPTHNFEEKVAIETVLLNQSASCDTHFGKVIKKNTF